MSLFPWKKKNKKKVTTEPLKYGTFYFVKGEEVVFSLGELDFTFEGFYVQILEEQLTIQVKNEVPMNLMNLLSEITEDVEVNRKDVLDADEVNFTLRLKDRFFEPLKEEFLKASDIRDIFDLELKGKTHLKSFSSYELVQYGTSSSF